MEKIDGDLVDLEKLIFEFLRPLPVEKTKNCPDLPIIRCFTLGIEPENPLQSGTGVTTEAAGLLSNFIS